MYGSISIQASENSHLKQINFITKVCTLKLKNILLMIEKFQLKLSIQAYGVYYLNNVNSTYCVYNHHSTRKYTPQLLICSRYKKPSLVIGICIRPPVGNDDWRRHD